MRTLRGGGHICGWWFCLAADCGSKICSGNGRPLTAPCCLLLVLVSMPLQIVNCRCSGFPVSGGTVYKRWDL